MKTFFLVVSAVLMFVNFVASASIDGATAGPPVAGPAPGPASGPGTPGDLTPAGTFILGYGWPLGGFGFGGGWGYGGYGRGWGGPWY